MVIINEQDCDSDEECIEKEAFFSDAAEEPEIEPNGVGMTEVYTCPHCGREWEAVHDYVGLWNPREDTYEYRA